MALWSWDSTQITLDSTVDATFDSADVQNYFAAGYFSTGYFAPRYFAGPTLPPLGDWFASGYFANGYFAEGYFRRTPSRPPQLYFAQKYFSVGYFAPGYFGGRAAAAGISVGNVALSLAGVGCDIDGSFFKATFTGSVAVALDGASANILAATLQLESFELSVSVTPTWHFTEYPGFSGSVVATLDDVGAAFAGTFRAVGAIDGQLGSALDGASGAVAGTHVAPANRTGVVSATLDDLLATNWVGATAAPGSHFGTVATILDGLTAQITGSNSVPSRTGTVVAQLDDVSGVTFGLSLLSGARVGTMTIELDGLSCTIVGVGPKFKVAAAKRIVNPRGTARRVIKVRKVR